MRPSILIVDDEKEVLKSLTRVLSGAFTVHTFSSPIKALAFFKTSPTHLVLSDMKMPEMQGEIFLENIRQLNPHTKCCVLTGYADGEATEKAINSANVSAYFNKPWDNQELKTKLTEMGKALYEEQQKAKRLKQVGELNKQLHFDKNTVNDALKNVFAEQAEVTQRLQFKKESIKQLIQLLSQLIASAQHEPLFHTLRVASHARALATMLKMNNGDVTHVYLAALLWKVGFIGAKRQILAKPIATYSRDEQRYIDSLTGRSAQLISMIDLLSPSADIIAGGLMYEAPERASNMGSCIVRIVATFDAIVRGRYTGEICSMDRAFVQMESFNNKVIDKGILRLYKTLMFEESTNDIERPKLMNELRAGMILAQDLENPSGQKLLAKGEVINEEQIEHLQIIEENVGTKLIAFIGH